MSPLQFQQATKRFFHQPVQTFSVRPFFLSAVIIAVVCACIGLLTHEEAAAQTIALTVNPYEGVDWEGSGQFKMNLHTHTTESDGQMLPARVIDEYHARGYHALAITDHDRNTWPWTRYERNPNAMGMLAIPGNELSRHHHTLSLFTTYETEERDHEAALAGVAEAGGLAILCHPAMHWVRDYNTAPSLHVPITPPLRSITQGDFTLELWFRTTDKGRNILLGNYASNDAGALNLELHTQNRVRLFLQPAGGGRTMDINVKADSLTIDARDGRWHHLAGIRRDNTVYLYLDGRLAGHRADQAGAFDLQGNMFFIGRDTRTGDTAFNGDLAQVRFWQRGFTQEEAAGNDASAPRSRDGLLAEYLFSEGPVVDTAAHEAGPFHGKVSGDITPHLLPESHEAMRRHTDTPYALTFGPGAFPQSVPEAAVQHYINLFKAHPHLVGMEVLNRTRPDREYPLDRELWDRLLGALMPDRPVWGAASDDMHGMRHLGGDWIMALADTLDEQTARTALAKGRYYFVSTRLHEPDRAAVEGAPRIDGIAHDPDAGLLTVKASVAGKPVPDHKYAWISNGQTIQNGAALSYRDAAKLGAYVRVEITEQGGTAYTNPFGFAR